MRLRSAHRSTGTKTLVERMKTLLPAIFLAGSMNISTATERDNSYDSQFSSLSSFLNTEMSSSVPLATRVLKEIRYKQEINQQFMSVLKSPEIHNKGISDAIIASNIIEVKEIAEVLSRLEKTIS